MGEESGKGNVGAQGSEGLIYINTEGVEEASGRLQDAYSAILKSYESIPAAYNKIKAFNKNGCMTSGLNKLHSGSESLKKHISELQSGAQALRNIAISYNNAEMSITGENDKCRELPGTGNPSGVNAYSVLAASVASTAAGNTGGGNSNSELPGTGNPSGVKAYSFPAASVASTAAGNAGGGNSNSELPGTGNPSGVKAYSFLAASVASTAAGNAGGGNSNSELPGTGNPSGVKAYSFLAASVASAAAGNAGGGKSDSTNGWKVIPRSDAAKDTPLDDIPWYDKMFDKSGYMSYGEVNRINYPEKGRYAFQRTFSKKVGVSLGNVTEKQDIITQQKKPIAGGDSFAPTKIGSIAEIYAEASCSWTCFGGQMTKVTDNYSYNLDGYLLRAQASAHAGVGAFMYKTADGQVVPAYGLSVDAGASFTLAGANVSGDIGPSYIGLGGDVKAAFGQVYANGNATVGMVGGKFVAVGSAQVGADLASVSGSFHGRLLGMEGGFGGKLKVGVSAKLEAGFDGGEFKFSLGASLGIGFEINISIDFSKVGSAIKAIGKNIKRIGSAIGEGARRAWRFLTRRW